MKEFSLLILVLFVTTSIKAQEYVKESKYSVNVSMGYGMNYLSYQTDDGKSAPSMGTSFNVECTYRLNKVVGLQIGCGLKNYKTKSTFNFMESTNSVDSDGDSYELRTYYNNLEEDQKALFLSIPLGIEYKKYFNEASGLFFNAGYEIAIPLSNNYDVVNGTIETTGYYSEWDVELADMEQHGFTTVIPRYSGEYKLKSESSVYIDLGYFHKLSGKAGLSVGGYLSYGLNNIIDPVDYDIYDDEEYYGTLQSNQTEKVKLISLGLKMTFYWDI